MADDANMEECDIDVKQEPTPDTPLRWWNAAIPIFSTIAFVMVGLVMTGYVVSPAGSSFPAAAAALALPCSCRCTSSCRPTKLPLPMRCCCPVAGVHARGPGAHRRQPVQQL
jgi:hypothetical protein